MEREDHGQFDQLDMDEFSQATIGLKELDTIEGYFMWSNGSSQMNTRSQIDKTLCSQH